MIAFVHVNEIFLDIINSAYWKLPRVSHTVLILYLHILYRASKKSDVNNYRLLSLVAIFTQIVERIIKNTLVNKYQYNFLAASGTVSGTDTEQYYYNMFGEIHGYNVKNHSSNFQDSSSV